MKYILIALLLIIPVTSHALDKKLGATNCFKIGMFDEMGGGIAGLDVTTPFSDFVVKIQCGANSVVSVNETGDTVTDEGGGYYYICTNDSITSNAEEECLAWIEGEGIALGMIVKSPAKFKAVGATMDPLGIGHLECDITASTSQTAFQIGTCVDAKGASVTLASGYFTGMPMYAYTNGGATCNVTGHGVMVESSTLNGSNLDVVASNNPAGSRWPATPSATNCGVKIGD